MATLIAKLINGGANIDVSPLRDGSGTGMSIGTFRPPTCEKILSFSMNGDILSIQYLNTQGVARSCVFNAATKRLLMDS